MFGCLRPGGIRGMTGFELAEFLFSGNCPVHAVKSPVSLQGWHTNVAGMCMMEAL
jgi:hypothetical protein